MKTNHTPGPWEMVDDYGRWEIDSKIHAIAIVNDNAPQHAANACLIAAAPDLLEQLQQAEVALHDFSKAGYPVSVLLRDIRAAIAKATGE